MCTSTNTGYNGFTAVMCLLIIMSGSARTARIFRELTQEAPTKTKVRTNKKGNGYDRNHL